MTCIYTGYADRASTAHGGDALVQGVAAAALCFQARRHHFEGAALGFETDCINRCIHTPKGRIIDYEFRRIGIVEIDGDHTISLSGEIEQIGVMIHHENFFHAQHPCAGGGHESHRIGAKDGDACTRPNFSIDQGLVSGRQDIAQEEHLVI